MWGHFDPSEENANPFTAITELVRDTEELNTPADVFLFSFLDITNKTALQNNINKYDKKWNGTGMVIFCF